MEKLPAWLLRRLVRLLRGVNAVATRSTTVRSFLKKVPGGYRTVDRLGKLAPMLLSVNTSELYYALISHSSNPQSMMAKNHHRVHPTELSLGGIEGMMLKDGQQYLPGDILTKVDRGTMAYGLECRAPLLDPSIVAYAWRLPETARRRNGIGKWILRETVHRRVPRRLMQRKKTGFSLPIDQWLGGALRDWTESLLDERRLSDSGVLDPVAIRQLWQRHLSGQVKAHHAIWDILMFQAWMANQPTAMPPPQ